MSREPRRSFRPATGARRWLLLALGWILLLVGVAGLFLPGLQGILTLLVGLLILERQSHPVHRLMLRLRERFPRLDRGLRRARVVEHRMARRFRGWMHRRFPRLARWLHLKPPDD